MIVFWLLNSTSGNIITPLIQHPCIISLFPFKFNQTLERTIDDSIERSLHRSTEGITKVHKELQEEITHLESKAKQKPVQSTEPVPTTPPEEASEDHTKYMPKS